MQPASKRYDPKPAGMVDYSGLDTHERCRLQVIDEAGLLGRIRNGDEAAFEQLVGLYEDRLYRFGIRMCGEREDARDVLQDTLLTAYRSLKNLQHPGALRSWLYRVASNACLMKRRRGKFEPDREISLEELVPDPDSGASEIPDVAALPDEELERTRIRSTVQAAVRSLPKQYRVVLVLRDMEHLSTSEAAEALGVPESTVKIRLHRARLMVRARLEEDLTRAKRPGGRP